MTSFWKIATGDSGQDWLVFFELGCIGIGWLPNEDYRRFRDEPAVLSALERAHGKGTPGYGSGAARIVYRFANEIEIGDVIVASAGYSRALGIGTVESEYLPPDATRNPLLRDQTTHRHHARIVDWVIKEPVDVPSRLFARQTLTSLSEEKIAAIRQAYTDAYPDDEEIASQLVRLLDPGRSPITPEASDVADVQPERVATTTYRILRDTALARSVKMMHNYECQICGETIVLSDDSRYAEAHHMRPLGNPHDGPDTIGNILCLCPNHHAECDLGAIILSYSSLRHVDGHAVSKRYIEYHNRRIYRNPSRQSRGG